LAGHLQITADPDQAEKFWCGSGILFDAVPGYQNDPDLDADPDPQHW
jgi:hypothetical protein